MQSIRHFSMAFKRAEIRRHLSFHRKWINCSPAIRVRRRAISADRRTRLDGFAYFCYECPGEREGRYFQTSLSDFEHPPALSAECNRARVAVLITSVNFLDALILRGLRRWRFRRRQRNKHGFVAAALRSVECEHRRDLSGQVIGTFHAGTVDRNISYHSVKSQWGDC